MVWELLLSLIHGKFDNRALIYTEKTLQYVYSASF